ncbi:hypothetical protein [Nostoc sp. 2RC]|uniref:hypothetical protein n=1 Tax=Nostoc sp. 2RC TaxID=2485484 RepID=UPI00162862FF|nr:hypothetical protein [Nostoc sp. 2RC]MBC1237594.1 hypothetical protein [Nostoc sp. 2RC]
MDTVEDLKFLEESTAKKYNPKFGDREYLVIQTYPLGKTVRVIYRSYSYQDAENKCSLENMAHDYSTFTTRIFHDGKLWIPGNISGIPYKISEQQFWDIHPDYKSTDIDGEIEICNCSYLYFQGRNNILTCLKDDDGRNITVCPNCGEILIEDEEDDDFTPSACRGCTNYHGDFYGDNQLICAIYPYGWSDDNCPDFLSE